METLILEPFKQMNFRMLPFDRVWDLEVIGGILELIDSGVAYWAVGRVAEPRELPLLFVLKEQEPLTAEGPKTHRVDLATIACGINRILSGSCEVNVDAIGSIAKFVATNDLSHVDIEDMDLIVQAGVYGKIVFG